MAQHFVDKYIKTLGKTKLNAHPFNLIHLLNQQVLTECLTIRQMVLQDFGSIKTNDGWSCVLLTEDKGMSINLHGTQQHVEDA